MSNIQLSLFYFRIFLVIIIIIIIIIMKVI